VCECLECALNKTCSQTKKLSELNGTICGEFIEYDLNFDCDLDGTWCEMSFNRLIETALDTEDDLDDLEYEDDLIFGSYL